MLKFRNMVLKGYECGSEIKNTKKFIFPNLTANHSGRSQFQNKIIRIVNARDFSAGVRGF